jgi:hypothetical protein
LSLPQQIYSRFGADAYSNMPWPTAFVPGSILLSSRNTAVKSTESLAVYERKSTGSEHLDLSN